MRASPRVRREPVPTPPVSTGTVTTSVVVRGRRGRSIVITSFVALLPPGPLTPPVIS